MCNYTPPAFQRQLFHFRRWLYIYMYLAYTKLLKCVYEKLAIVDEYLVDHCRMLTHDHHLDNRLCLSHLSRRRCPINDVHSWMARPRMSGPSGQLKMTEVTEATSKTICPKNISGPYLETPDISTKSWETHVWNKALYTIVQIFTPIGTR